MRLVLVSMNFAPELTGIGKYSGEMAEHLAALGHDVRVVCAPPYYPHWQLQAGWSRWRYVTEHPRPGLTVHRCPVWVPRSASGLNRLLHLASFALSSLPLLLWLALWRPAAFLAVAPALIGAPGAWLAARLCGAKAWLHVQDLEVDAAFELGLLRGAAARRTMLLLERCLLRSFDKVSTISRRMLRQLAVKGMPLDRLELIPNWIDFGVIHPADHSPALRRELGIGAQQLVCLFAGTMNRKQGLRVLVDTARELQGRSDIVVVMCGDGEMRSALEQSARDLANMRFIDLRPADGMNALLNMADIHLLPQLRGAAELVMPSKLTGMLASGRVVLAAAPAGSEIATMLSGRGMTIEPESAAAFAVAIDLLAGDPALRTALGEAGHAYAKAAFDVEAVMRLLDQRLRELCDVAGVPVLDDASVHRAAPAAIR